MGSALPDTATLSSVTKALGKYFCLRIHCLMKNERSGRSGLVLTTLWQTPHQVSLAYLPAKSPLAISLVSCHCSCPASPWPLWGTESLSVTPEEQGPSPNIFSFLLSKKLIWGFFFCFFQIAAGKKIKILKSFTRQNHLFLYNFFVVD